MGAGLKPGQTSHISLTLNVDDANPNGETVAQWVPELTQAILAAHRDLEEISPLRFSQIADGANGSDGADIDYWYYRNPSDGASGYSYGVGGRGVFIDADSVYAAPGFADGLAYGGVNYRHCHS